ncbi:NADPH-dependent 7-cyano-7-deazaguanine reductase [Striga asiatica]|uniref:NADPH-dependent 7-cyano-7-deazaguanine reductase n=1 Tax=Striga asiatica TaxID=4170 RepID=A0A5A7PK08_STRAF|nr:NADPH-dependent 7-cyano-7-deazaguanine reductase [Striga asiatica]
MADLGGGPRRSTGVKMTDLGGGPRRSPTTAVVLESLDGGGGLDRTRRRLALQITAAADSTKHSDDEHRLVTATEGGGALLSLLSSVFLGSYRLIAAHRRKMNLLGDMI